MIEANNPEINVDELMEKIREEVRRRKEGGGMPPRTVPHTSDVPHTSASLPKISPVGEPEPFRTKEDGYHINDFLKYHDQQFIINAYRGILRRGPDSAGHDHFLNSLRSGRMTKAEILGRLRYSPEGRTGKVNIRGLFWNFVIQSSYNSPVLGYFSRLAVGIANLPSIIRNIQVIEESTFSLSHQQQTQLAAAFKNLGPILDRKPDSSQLGQLKSEIEALLDHKPNRDELGSVKAALESVLGRKIEHDALENLKSDLQLMLDQKPNRDELGNLKAELDSILAHKLNNKDLNPVYDQLRDILRQTRDHKLNIIDQQRRLKLLLEEAQKRLPESLPTDQIRKMVKEKDHLLDAAYVSFEDQFRGTREDIKERLTAYLPYISQAGAGKEDSPIIDVGCGRGEWLELLNQEGVIGKGIDNNMILAHECIEHGLDVQVGDAIELLRKEEATSCGAITAFHLVEHLPAESVIALFDESLRVLKSGGIIIFETPNPDNLMVGARNFYIDPTHRNPIPSPTLSWIAESRGFQDVQILNLHPVPDYDRDQTVQDPLKSLLYGPQDYAIIGHKV